MASYDPSGAPAIGLLFHLFCCSKLDSSVWPWPIYGFYLGIAVSRNLSDLLDLPPSRRNENLATAAAEIRVPRIRPDCHSSESPLLS